jgi:hypothetical protein
VRRGAPSVRHGGRSRALVSLPDDYVERFKAGVRSGDSEPILALLRPEAELEFTGIPVGPSQGVRRSARRTASSRPTTRSSSSTGSTKEAPSTRGQQTHPDPQTRVHLEGRDGAIVRIRVLYEQFS